MIPNQIACHVCLEPGAWERSAEPEDGHLRAQAFDVNCPRCGRFTITRAAIEIIRNRYDGNRESIAAYVVPQAREGREINSEMLGEPKKPVKGFLRVESVVVWSFFLAAIALVFSVLYGIVDSYWSWLIPKLLFISGVGAVALDAGWLDHPPGITSSSTSAPPEVATASEPSGELSRP